MSNVVDMEKERLFNDLTKAAEIMERESVPITATEIFQRMYLCDSTPEEKETSS